MSQAVSIQTRGRARILLPSSLRVQVQRQLARAVRAAGARDAVVCVSFSDDAELHQLNQTYAQEDHPTDVLSFAQPAAHHLTPMPLGDIIVSVETASRQAETAGHPLAQELLHLAVHGLCHLLGYDHATPEEERVMFGYEALLRAQALAAGRVQRVAQPPKPHAK